ncbi:MAG: pirin family protein [FCB group bacterium]|jgi:redox-sensitive bicupin YhaK (pirin superfamily)|nr:pirin family protein [FCB group bacterium]
MITLRRSEQRGRGEHGWLDSRHTFSFADYHHPDYMGFGVLRVINEDRVQGGAGFGTHGHRDMEIISYVLEGALQHRDSMGNGSVLREGDFQRMSAGTGVRHSEFNPSETEPVHFYQIWLLPARLGIEPSYEERRFGDDAERGLILVASPDGADGSMRINQDARVHLVRLAGAAETSFRVEPGRRVWVQVTRGGLTVDGTAMNAGDGAAVTEQTSLLLRAEGGGEALLFDVP